MGVLGRCIHDFLSEAFGLSGNQPVVAFSLLEFGGPAERLRGLHDVAECIQPPSVQLDAGLPRPPCQPASGDLPSMREWPRTSSWSHKRRDASDADVRTPCIVTPMSSECLRVDHRSRRATARMWLASVLSPEMPGREKLFAKRLWEPTPISPTDQPSVDGGIMAIVL